MDDPAGVDGLRSELDRQRARLARERSARRQSEDIAEATLRRLYQRQVELDLLSRVAAIANGARGSAEESLVEAMTAVREATGWQVGHYLVPARDDPTVMVTSGHWSGDTGDPFLQELRMATAGMRFPPGVGIPGSAFVGGAQWEEDIAHSRNFPRQKWLEGGSAWAFPMLVGHEVAGVIEFLHRAPRPRDESLLEVAGILGVQLGRVIERDRAERQQFEHQAALRKAVEDRTADLLAARARAEAESRARSTLFSTISHDLKTPLHAALSELRGDGSQQPLRERVRLATGQLVLLEQRIQAMVELAGVAGASEEDRPSVVDLSRVLHEVVGAHNLATGGGAGDADIGVSGGASHPVLVDVGLFERIVHTLLTGRLLDPPAAGGRIRLDVRSTRAELVFSGPGFAPGGSSIGLAGQLAESGDGGLRVATLPDGRQQVVVHLPIAAGDRHRRGCGPTVLLVDDIAVTRQIGVAMLRRIGAEVVTAADGREALEVLRRTPVALVLMDLRMPVMGGLEAARRIRAGEAGEDRSEVPIVALTAHAAAGDSDRSLLAGMDAHMTKPFTVDELRQVVLGYAPDVAEVRNAP